MREKLEIIFNQDDTMFLNFWDWVHGNDVCCEIKDGKIYLWQYDENGEQLPNKAIGFMEFLALVKDSIAQRTV